MSLISKIFSFYYQGFKAMTIGKTLWLIILVKLFIMFGIIKLIFFPATLSKMETEQEKANYIRNQLTIDNSITNKN